MTTIYQLATKLEKIISQRKKDQAPLSGVLFIGEPDYAERLARYRAQGVKVFFCVPQKGGKLA